MNTKLIISVIAGVFTATSISSCRSPRRGVRVGSDTSRLDITMTGLANEDAGKNNWTYELSGCLPPINGELREANVVSFTAIGLKSGLENCQFRVKTLQPAATIKFVEGSEPNVLYWSRALTISQNAAGQLISEASLQKLFEVITPGDARKTFSLKIPVKFSKAETERLITAAINCTPDTANLGIFTRIDDLNGEIAFKLPIEADIAYSCTDLYINVNGDTHKFKGAFSGEAGKFTGSADKVITLQPLDVIFQAPGTTPDPTKDNVKVSTKKGEECNVEGKIFDVATGECKAK